MQKGFSGILILVVVLIVAFGAGAYYLGYDHGWEKLGKTSTIQTPSPSPSSIPARDVTKETASWRTYTNPKLGFSIKYPRTISKYKGEWEYREFDGGYVGFRPSSIKGDYLWGVNVHTNQTVGDLIDDIGRQFSDRKVERKNITIAGKSALLVIVTTPSITDWIAKVAFIENGGKIFSIGNGAREDSEFDLFYNSFKLID